MAQIIQFKKKRDVLSMDMNLKVDFGYNVEEGKTYLCAVVVDSTGNKEVYKEERNFEMDQYLAGMNAFCLASKSIKDYQEDVGYPVGFVNYRSVQQYLDLWVKKGKHKKYGKQIKFINQIHKQIELENWDYEQQKGGREGKKNNLALGELYSKGKGKNAGEDPFSVLFADSEEKGIKVEGNPFAGNLKQEKNPSSNVVPFKF
ncbi:hypothetical protein GLW05_20920 [Pontibacillus yanchengensis]|uniref:Uncharacterized protein n=1 Tax=Pontibacillus yanchengensis TaxID=462910 RepID=A0A6I5A6U6_9BACI|nr:hypothetical protein [Pontibacillus yanchengensis]MYL36037.1 hypothetical protein [Pontibacillus yanchengensis]